ncbi:MAG: LacI family DNA-binding transcriptional regulator [Acholeplasmataceae bacterium]|jgi:LacI family transcriptional regulator
MKPTIRDVAKEANVSVSTVSRVINNKESVHESTRVLVLEAIEKLGFVPNKLAQSLTSNSSKMVAVFVPHIGPEFYGHLLEGIESQAGAYGYKIIICNTQNNPERELDYLRFVEHYNIDGLIVASDFLNIKKIQELNIPIVTVDHTLDETYPSVTSDNIKGGRLGAEALVKSGAKNILLFRGPSFLPTTIERTIGAKEVFDSHPDIKYTYYDFDLVTPDFHEIENVLKSHCDIDGIFAYGDTLAIVTTKILNRLGKKIPHDVRIVGFDNNYFSMLSYPPLTTIEQSPSFMGKSAFNLLYKLMKNQTIDEPHLIVDVKLVSRQSTT